ncbi:MAG: prepilin peptidase [Dongiaceae bacterium]
MFANLLVSQIVVAAFVGLLIAAAISDVRQLIIPNRYCAAIVLLYPIYVLTAPLGVDWSAGAIVGAVALAIGFLLFAMRLAGGGDVKFFAAVSVWAGTDLLDQYVFATALVGGLIAIVMLIQRKLASPRAAAARPGFLSRSVATVNLFFGRAAAQASAMAVGANPGSPGPRHAEDSASDSNPGRPQPVGTLPYGAAISFGGIVVAAMLLMRG